MYTTKYYTKIFSEKGRSLLPYSNNLSKIETLVVEVLVKAQINVRLDGF